MNKATANNNIDRLLDVEMDVTVRFGSTELPLNEVANFGSGSIIELNRTVDQPVELLINNYPFARGEVVVIDGYYGVRITDIDASVDPSGNLIPDSKTSADNVTSPNYQNTDPESKNPESPDKPVQNVAQPDAAPEKTKPKPPENKASEPVDKQPKDDKEV